MTTAVVGGMVVVAPLLALSSRSVGNGVAVASGHAGKTVWVLEAAQAGNLTCVWLTIDGVAHGKACGDASPGSMYVSTSGSSTRKLVVYGATSSNGKQVRIALSNGHTISAQTVQAPGRSFPHLVFFAITLPCGTYARSLVAIGSNGQMVAAMPQIDSSSARCAA
jgi:hypothetical protein